MRLLHMIVDGILSDTLLIFPLLVFVGLLLADRSFPKAIAGALTVLLGWIGLLIGLHVMLKAVGSVDMLAGHLFGWAQGEPTRAVLAPRLEVKGAFAHAQAATVLLAFVVNILWARLSPARYLFLNPIHVLLGSALLLILFLRAGANPYVAVPIVSLLIGSAMAWLPYLANRPYVLMSQPGRPTLGSFHTGLLLGVAALAPKLGGSETKKRKPAGEDAGDMALGSPLLFSGIVVGLLCLLLAINAGEEKTTAALATIDLLSLLPTIGSSFYLIGALIVGFTFAAGLWLIIQAIPLVLRGVDEAFAGWQKLLPGTRPALDALFMLSEAPRTAVIGFLLSLAGGILGFFLFGWMGLTSVVPGMLVALSAGHLVGGGAAAIIAEKRGGQRAMWAIAPAHGLLLSFLAALVMTASASLSKGGIGVAVELSDLSVVGSLIAFILWIFT